jgi:hypothetical protein
VRLAQVLFDDRGAGDAAHHVPGVRDDHGVYVHVHHPGVAGRPLRDLVHVLRRGQADADFDELADARIRGQEANGPAEERPVRRGRVPHVRGGTEYLVNGHPVGRVMVLPAEQVVVHARCTGNFRPEGLDTVILGGHRDVPNKTAPSGGVTCNRIWDIMAPRG